MAGITPLPGRIIKTSELHPLLSKEKENITVLLQKKFRITVQKNAVYTVSRLKYKISNADTSGKGTVVFTGATDKAARKALTIPTKLLRAKGAGPKIIVTK